MTLPAQVDIAVADTEESLYVVPGGTSSTVRIIVVNRNSGPVLFRVAHVPGGGSATDPTYLAYDRSVVGYQELMSAIIDMSAADEIRVQSDTLNVTFQVQGIERT